MMPQTTETLMAYLQNALEAADLYGYSFSLHWFQGREPEAWSFTLAGYTPVTDHRLTIDENGTNAVEAICAACRIFLAQTGIALLPPEI